MTVKSPEAPPVREHRPVPAVQARRRPSTRPRLLPYGLLLPAVVVVAVVSVFPIVFALNLSLHETRFTQLEDFVGLDNYAAILGSSAGWASIGRSLIYVVASLALAIPMSLGIAHLLNRPARFRLVFRALILMPWVISQTVAALLWRWLLNADYGPLGLGDVAGTRIDVFADPVQAMAALILVNVWISYPLATILCLAALQTIPAELEEASDVDGAGPFTRFRRITLPMMAPTLFVVAILLTLLYFNMVTLVLTFTAGGPFGATQLVSLDAFNESFSFFNLGLGAAYSVILFVFNIVFGAAYIKLIRSEGDG
ncbi:sugar ABC transporter permease [Jiangella aurantiaca]|uniref:Sugar ABC transporter permease n=1 Tax=Jiangella aurantiaca TaxID=2530373 RepID=A0A4R5ABJ3_9ACTN|nr:sugar ABC transporter permease [Jiangella aurantiaca]TDD69055.1 sugar ABC transporter permease [Jiangella aurantiaca]